MGHFPFFSMAARRGGLAFAVMTHSFCHLELSTDDRAAAAKFYKSLFGWKFKDMPAMQYSMFQTGGKGSPGGGIGAKNMPNQPTAWMPYVEVASVEKTIAKAQAAGATIYVAYQPMGGNGAIGVFADPTGAAIGVWEAAKKTAPKKAEKKAAKKAGAAKAGKKSDAKAAKKSDAKKSSLRKATKKK